MKIAAISDIIGSTKKELSRILHMKNFDFFELDEAPNLRVGRRIIKTVIAVFICAIIAYFRGTTTAIVSMVAAVLCIQPTRYKSVMFAVNRIIGTLLGGLLGTACLYFARLIGLTNLVPLYYLFISLMLIPLILLTLLIRRPSVSSFACVVFLMVSVTLVDGAGPVMYAVQRTLETLIGIVVALVVNRFFPKRKTDADVD